ncbi:MAG: hypothetical protein ACRYFX_12810 [Janthinobacterium lividum]
MRPLFFCVLVLALLGACSKLSAPLKLYFIGSNRFVSGSRNANSGDTLAVRLYADDSLASPSGIKHLQVTIDYSPRTEPFLYPTPLTSFQLAQVRPSTVHLVYFDSAYAAMPRQLLYTTVFGVRTTTGNEVWNFTVTDQAGNSSNRAFTLRQRRSDSTAVYNDYTLRLNLLAGTGVRRFIDLKSGLAFPGFTALNPTNADILQPTLDAVLRADGSLVSPDYFNNQPALLSTTRWKTANRSSTRFALTTLNDVSFLLQTDTLAFHTLFNATTPTNIISGLTTKQVYAFRVKKPASTVSQYGLLLVANTTSGLQLQVRVAKQPL